MRWLRGLGAAAILALAHGSAGAADPTPRDAAKFALIVGVNAAPEKDLAPLRYADDDAARFQDLFRMLGAHTVVLARLDENTRRLHPQAAAEAREPRATELARAVAEIEADIAKARSRGVPTMLYFVYAGHGNIDDGHGYLTLEDTRLTGAQIATQIIERVGADRSHMIVDACHSYFLAAGRGPGGSRRPARGFVEVEALARQGRVGLLLASTSSGESHEWEAFQAGVFSHEVRSGLHGAADADGDGTISYREMAAFVQRANAGIANEKYRPSVYARPPVGDEMLADLRPARGKTLRIDRAHHAHWVLEDSLGVRLAEVHNGAAQDLVLLRPAGAGPVFLRNRDDGREAELPLAPNAVTLAELEMKQPTTAVRGAEHVAFNQIFAAPFDADAMIGVTLADPVQEERLRAEEDRIETARRHRRWAAAGALTVAAAAGAGAALCLVSAGDIRNGISPTTSQAEAAAANDRIDTRNLGAGLLIGAGVAAAAAGAALLLWPERRAQPFVAPTAGGATAGWTFDLW